MTGIDQSARRRQGAQEEMRALHEVRITQQEELVIAAVLERIDDAGRGDKTLIDRVAVIHGDGDDLNFGLINDWEMHNLRHVRKVVTR